MRSVVVFVAVLAFMLTAFVGCSHFTGKTAGQSLDDTVITGDIKTKMLKDPELKTFAVDVSSYQGNVTLSGMVPNRASEQRLIQYAQDTKGVRSVRTNLQIAGMAPGRTGGAAAASTGTAPAPSTMGAPSHTDPSTGQGTMEKSEETKTETTTTEESTSK